MYDELLSNLRGGNDRQRRSAAFRLGNTSDPAVVPHLIRAYDDPDPFVRRNIIDGLGKIDTPDATQFLNSSEVERQRIIRQRSVADTETESEQGVSRQLLEKPAPEALTHLDRAFEMWQAGDEAHELSESQKLDIASELALAIHKANAPFPDAHALLAMLLNELGDDERADYHARLALRQDPNEFRAQLVRLDVELKDVRFVNLSAGDFVAAGGTLEEAYFGSIGKSIGSLIAAGHAGITQSRFNSEVSRLIQIFGNLCEAGVDANEYLFMADTLIDLGDFARDLPFSGGHESLYAAVVNTPVDNIDRAGREDDFAAIRSRAKGRLLLFK